MKPVGKRPNSPDRIRRDQRRLLRDFFSHIVHILATSGTATFFSNDDAEFWAEHSKGFSLVVFLIYKEKSSWRGFTEPLPTMATLLRISRCTPRNHMVVKIFACLVALVSGNVIARSVCIIRRPCFSCATRDRFDDMNCMGWT